MAVLLSYALTTLADVKESLGITDGSKDNLIIRKINQATEMIEGYCGFDQDHHFAQTTYTDEIFDPTYSNQIVLRARPVTSVTALSARDTNTNESDFTTVDTEDYFINSGAGTLNLLFSTMGGWGRYRVSYVAGFSTIPADLAEACVVLAGYLVENASSSGAAVKRKTEGQRGIEYFEAGQNVDSIFDQLGLDDMLSRYRNYVL